VVAPLLPTATGILEVAPPAAPPWDSVVVSSPRLLLRPPAPPPPFSLSSPSPLGRLSVVGLLLCFSSPLCRMLPFHRRSSTKSSRVMVWSWFWGLGKASLDFRQADNGCACCVAYLAGGVVAMTPIPLGLQGENLSCPLASSSCMTFSPDPPLGFLFSVW
jgi:hypothetical protein